MRPLVGRYGSLLWAFDGARLVFCHVHHFTWGNAES